ncbi:isatin hydrolase-like [Lycorma delicatula]|uniref:isatin hydrolase-like n=1 Tax=Lycorma delicatula TaxID=130591 RepID=UPI003F51417D
MTMFIINIILFISLILKLKCVPVTSKYNMIKHKKIHQNFNKIDELKQQIIIIDIGYSFDENNIQWVGKSPFTITKTYNGTNNFLPFYTFNDIKMFDYSGTHLDAPYQFDKKGWKVADIPLNNLLVPGCLLDMRNETTNNPEFLLKPEHIIEWENEYGPIPNNSVLLINFGWSSRWYNKNSYLGLMNDGTRCHFPGISKEAAEWIIKTEKIVGVGVDTASVDAGATADFEVHQILSSANIYNIENVNLNNDIELPAQGFNLIVMPMKITEGSGAPCRIIAILSKNNNKSDDNNSSNSNRSYNVFSNANREQIFVPVLFIVLLISWNRNKKY